jgi:hypothetical protein
LIGLQTSLTHSGEGLHRLEELLVRAIADFLLAVLTSDIDEGFTVNPQGGYTTPSGHEVPDEHMDKPWYDIRGDTKKELLVSGLAVGLGLLGGAMYMNHEKHEKQDEEEVRESLTVLYFV